MLVTNILKRSAYQVVIARDGLEAVDLFSRGAADLILMDMQMPKLGGLEATAAIRKLEGGRAADSDHCFDGARDGGGSRAVSGGGDG